MGCNPKINFQDCFYKIKLKFKIDPLKTSFLFSLMLSLLLASNPSSMSFFRNFSTQVAAETARIRRTGALAFKKGMLSFWDAWGVRHPVTVLHVSRQKDSLFLLVSQLDNVQALDTFRSGETLIQNLGIGHKSARNVHSAQLKLFERCGVAPKRAIRGFPIAETAKLKPGQFIYANHFLPGQFIDVQGTR